MAFRVAHQIGLRALIGIGVPPSVSLVVSGWVCELPCPDVVGGVVALADEQGTSSHTTHTLEKT